MADVSISLEESATLAAQLLRLQAARVRFEALVMLLRGGDVTLSRRSRLTLRLTVAWLRMMRETASARICLRSADE